MEKKGGTAAMVGVGRGETTHEGFSFRWGRSLSNRAREGGRAVNQKMDHTTEVISHLVVAPERDTGSK